MTDRLFDPTAPPAPSGPADALQPQTRAPGPPVLPAAANRAATRRKRPARGPRRRNVMVIACRAGCGHTGKLPYPAGLDEYGRCPGCATPAAMIVVRLQTR